MSAGGRRLLSWTLAVAVTAAAAFVLPRIVAGWWLGREDGAWRRADPAAAARLDGEWAEGANATARRLTDLARMLGVELQVFRSADPETAPAVAFVEAARAAEADGGDGPNAALDALLARTQGPLDAVETLLVTSDPPAWPHDFRRAHDASPPPVLGLRTLNALLLARAAARDRAGDAGGAERALLASSRLDDGVRERPEAIAQTGTVALAVERAAVLRRLVAPPAAAADRVGAHDFRRTFLASYLMTARVLTDSARRAEAARPDDAALLRAFQAPFARLSAADASRRLRALAGVLRAAEPCRVDTDALAAAPGWNRVARATVPHAAQRWRAVALAELEQELSRVVLDTRAQPPSAPDGVPSRVCSGLVWTRSPQEDGGTTVSAGGATLPPRARGAAWRYHVGSGVASSQGRR